MRLVDRLSQNSGAAATPEAPAGSLIGGTPVRKRDDIAEGSRRLKIRVHNRLLETLDVSKLDALEPAMVSGKVTSAINETLDDEGRLLTDIDRARLVNRAAVFGKLDLSNPDRRRINRPGIRRLQPAARPARQFRHAHAKR